MDSNHGYRYDERLKTKNEESTRLTDTGLVVELENLKTKTRLLDEKFASVPGCVSYCPLSHLFFFQNAFLLSVVTAKTLFPGLQ